MDKSNAVTVKYDKMPLPKPLPSDQVEHPIPDWVERERESMLLVIYKQSPTSPYMIELFQGIVIVINCDDTLI